MGTVLHSTTTTTVTTATKTMTVPLRERKGKKDFKLDCALVTYYLISAVTYAVRRHDDCDVIIRLPNVSAVHCGLVLTEKGVRSIRLFTFMIVFSNLFTLYVQSVTFSTSYFPIDVHICFQFKL